MPRVLSITQAYTLGENTLADLIAMDKRYFSNSKLPISPNQGKNKNLVNRKASTK